ncbi:unnamed protein product [Lupinus luteus]|uniref:Uncharacterized protein n=1 Tax=Lupinus luteus TaxID=3873 RepID=A0AAV1Y3H0_LUPLU
MAYVLVKPNKSGLEELKYCLSFISFLSFTNVSMKLRCRGVNPRAHPIKSKFNNKNAIAIDPVGPKGIKKRECLCKGRKRPQSWVEKMARKRKGNQLLRLRKCQSNLEAPMAQPVATTDAT